jgi:hypothetical protein
MVVVSIRYYGSHMSAKAPSPSDLADKFMLRLPAGMRQRIADSAHRSNRSMNAEIIYRLEYTFSRKDSDEGLPTNDEKLSSITHLLEEIGRLAKLASKIRLAKITNNTYSRDYTIDTDKSETPNDK